MNIFVLSDDPFKAAHYMCDKHVVKMILETTQMLSTVASRYGGTYVPYKPTHRNHPCTLWAGENFANYTWLLQHGFALVIEYHNRYNKDHKCDWLIDGLAQQVLSNKIDIPDGPLTPFAQAMPEKYKCNDAVQAYRAYYIGEKARFAKWRYCDTPEWWPIVGG